MTTNPVEPVLPLVAINVTPTISSTVLRGVGFRGGSYVDTTPILPLTGAPATEIRGVHVQFLTAQFFPMRMWTPNHFPALGGTIGTNLLLTPVQHRAADAVLGTTTRRVYTNLNLRLYYSGNLSQAALSDAPAIVSVDGQFDGSGVAFTVRVVGDPAAGMQEVWITYTDGSGTWSLAQSRPVRERSVPRDERFPVVEGAPPPRHAAAELQIHRAGGERHRPRLVRRQAGRVLHRRHASGDDARVEWAAERRNVWRHQSGQRHAACVERAGCREDGDDRYRWHRPGWGDRRKRQRHGECPGADAARELSADRRLRRRRRIPSRIHVRAGRGRTGDHEPRVGSGDAHDDTDGFARRHSHAATAGGGHLRRVRRPGFEDRRREHRLRRAGAASADRASGRQLQRGCEFRRQCDVFGSLGDPAGLWASRRRPSPSMAAPTSRVPSRWEGRH